MRQAGCLPILIVTGLATFFLGPAGLMFGPIIYLLFSGRIDRLRHIRGGSHYGHQQTVTPPPILVLFAAVMKADGRIMRSELDYVRDFLVRSLGPGGAQRALIQLRDLLKQRLPLAQACMQLRMTHTYAQRQAIMTMLFELAQVDGNMDTRERNLLAQIANALGVENAEYSRMYDTFHAQEVDYYTQLGLTQEATNEEVRQAYRQLAMKWHPDRYSHQGEEAAKKASEEFKKINQAYEKIRKQRGMK